MGMIHFLAAKRAAGVSVAAVQSRDAKKRAGDWRGIRGNFGPPGAVMDLAGVTAYETFDELIADPLVDLVDLTAPTPQHEFLSIQALKAGKHVLVEKPIALEVEAADRMLAAARGSGQLLMVAHVLPCFSEFRYALEATQSGRYGRLLAGHFTRVITRPDWSAADGGPAVDLHIHDTHFIRTLVGRPREVVAAGTVENDIVTHLTTLYRFEEGPALGCTCGALVAKARPFAHGFELYFESATLTFGPGQPLTVLGEDGTTKVVEVDSDPVAAFTYEIERAAASVVAGKPDSFLDAAAARDALVICQREIESVRTGRSVAV